MQRERSALDSFPEPIDLNQGSVPNNTSMDHSASWDNMLSPVDNRFSNYLLGPNDGSVTCMNASNDSAQSFSGWDRGESSSSANNMQDGSCVDGSKTSLGWSSSFKACSESDERSANWSIGPSNISTTCNVGNQVIGRSPSMQNYNSNHGSLNMSSNHGHLREHDRHNDLAASLPHHLYKSGSQMEQIPSFYASSSNVGTFSGSPSAISENNDGPSFGTWGSSCKRKAVEGTSGQFYPGGSSSSNQSMGNNIMQHRIPGGYTAPGNLSISSVPLSLSPTMHSEQLNPSAGIGMSRVAPSFFTPSSIPGVAEGSARSFSIRSNHRHHESVPFDTPRSTPSRNIGVYAAQLSQPISNADPSQLTSPVTPPMNLNNNLNHRHPVHVNEARGMHSYPWNGSLTSQGGSSSSSFIVSGERGFGTRDEVNVRSSLRNNQEYPMTVSTPETRNVLQDQVDWSFAPGTSSSSRNHSSGSRIGHSSSGGRTSSSSWLTHQNQASQNHQRLSEAAPWVPFHHADPETGISRGHLGLLHAASSSSGEAGSISRAQHQFDQRSAALLMDMQGEDGNGRRGLAAIEGRHRLVNYLH